MNLNSAPAWILDTAAKNGIKTGQFRIVASPSHNTDGVFTPGKVRVWNTRKTLTLTFGTDLKDETVTDQDVWEMTR
jgi:hypothetical protein